MNFRRNLRNISLLLVFGICLITIGYLIYLSNKNKIVEVISSPILNSVDRISYAKVTKVIDGDTIVIDTGQKVRYIGMNTPEIETNECFATSAAEINRNLVLGQTVKLEKDSSEVDKYGRILRYVYIGNEMINDELVKDGSARVETVPPDIKYKQKFLESEKYARENKLGLWGKCYNPV